MPRTGALLTAEEREGFTLWLRGVVSGSGLRKSELARLAFGDESTARLNRYLRLENAELPTAEVLARLAGALQIAWPVPFWRAGYYRELLDAIALFAMATFVARITKDPKAGPLTPTPEVLSFGLVDFALRAFPRRDTTGRVYGPIPEGELDGDFLRLLAALCPAFDHPFNPDDKKRAKYCLGDERLWYSNRLLVMASEALQDARAPAHVRRAVAGEYVNAWADEFNFESALIVRERQRGEHAIYGAALRAMSEEQPRFRSSEVFRGT